MKCGEIWTAVFSESSVGYEYVKDRPVLVIESDCQIKVTNVVTVVPLSSKEKNHSDDIVVIKDARNNLWHDSAIKVHHIQSIDRTCRFIKKIGEVDDETMGKVKNYLRKHFGL